MDQLVQTHQGHDPLLLLPMNYLGCSAQKFEDGDGPRSPPESADAPGLGLGGFTKVVFYGLYGILLYYITLWYFIISCYIIFSIQYIYIHIITRD